MPHTKPDFYFFFIIFFTTLSPSSIGFCPAQPKFSPWRWVSAHTSPALLHPPFLRGGPRWTLGPVTLVLRCDGLSSPVTLQHSWSHVSFLVFCPPLPPFFFLFPSLNGFHWIHIDFFFIIFFLLKPYPLTFSSFDTTWTLDVKVFTSLDLSHSPSVRWKRTDGS